MPRHGQPVRRRLFAASLAIGALFATDLSAQGADGQGFDLEERRQEHWAWQQLQTAKTAPDAPPTVDGFIRARLTATGLSPAAPAAPHTALRRLWLDLVGLPPAPETVRAFVADPSEAAWNAQVDVLLDSPQFGERWARHWLDLVRYAETLGHEFDFPLPNAWRYRDYVIRAFNADLPYDQFLREHVAGDLLPEPRRNENGENESVQATAAWWFVEQTHSPVDARQHQADRIDNQIDVLGKAMLGMTVACARCHDHKFDAISQADYYSLFGFVKSSRYVQAPIAPADTTSPTYRDARAGHHRLAQIWASTAAPANPRWDTLQRAHPERWSASTAIGALRAGDRMIASAATPDTGWHHTNDAFGAAPWRGPWCPDPTSDKPELHLLPGAFWHSGIAGRRREGTLATDTFEISERYLHVRAAGRQARLVVIVDGFHVVRDPIYGGLNRRVDRAEPQWFTFDLKAWLGRPAVLHCIDQVAHDIGDPIYQKESNWPTDGWLAVAAVVGSDDEEPPPAELGLRLPYRPWDTAPAAVQQRLDGLAAAQAALPAPSPTLPALADSSGSDEQLYIRGNHRTPGARQPRRFLSALAGNEPMSIRRGSGRLELADAILAPDNPLPTRTIVNRIWHHLFGRGLSRSVDNLGVLGDPPTHPDLLDWLARDFVAHGWSIKHTIRRIVRSATYRQSSRSRTDGERTDPANLLLHRQNVRRLEAEAVRDSLLAVSGELQNELYGPSIPIPHESVTHARGKPRRSGPIDGDGRRSVYLAVRRNFMPPMLHAFDLPTPFAPVGRRSVSNVPAQALTLLNDPFVHLMCERWADRLLAAPAADLEARISQAWQTAFARAPRADELQRVREFLRAAVAADGTTIADAAPWRALLHCLVNTKEFTFRR
ncbi:MAG: DUF1549 and DUF1553 domain-containing protein [bacterium]|nr:DUF1549 and DUF1553 domain-containing protein [bacterium]